MGVTSTAGVVKRMVALMLAFFSSAAGAEIRVVDDAGRTTVLERPARRIVSLAPHVTELIFAAGAGDRLVGAVDYSDYPEAANAIPRVGSSRQLDLERIVSLKPDLVVGWQHGSSQRQVEALRQAGLQVFLNEPRRLSHIGRAIEQIGRLAGTEAAAGAAARSFASREAELRAKYSARPPVRVFWQIWEKPLMTINGAHLISDVISLCGGENVFAALVPLVPTISTEAVLKANPEVIGMGYFDDASRTALESWKKWPRLTATARENLVYIHSELITRHTPRMLDGARAMCEAFEAARAKRPR